MMNNETFDFRKTIQLRLAEKKKFISARKWMVGLLFATSGFIMFVLLRVALLTETRSITVPKTFWAVLMSIGILNILFQRIKSLVLNNEIERTTRLVKLSTLLSGLSIGAVIYGIKSVWGDFHSFQYVVVKSFTVFLSFYVLNLVIGLILLLMINRKLSAFKIHSWNMDFFNMTHFFWLFLFSSLFIFTLLI